MIGIFALIALAVYLSAGEFRSQVTATVQKIAFNTSKSISAGTGNLFFDVTIALNNPTSFFVTIQSQFIEIFYQGKRIGVINSETPVKIGAKGTTIVSLPVQLETASIISIAANAWKDLKSLKLFVNVRGTMRTTAGTVTFTENVQLI